VNTPDYIRDNIHVSLLAQAYVTFIENLGEGPGFERYCPSGYAEKQGVFIERFSCALKQRFKLPCQVVLDKQIEFLEPLKLVNKDEVKVPWDELASFYKGQYL